MAVLIINGIGHPIYQAFVIDGAHPHRIEVGGGFRVAKGGSQLVVGSESVYVVIIGGDLLQTF